MPTYDYKCKDCGHLFEEFQKIDDDPIEICPVCKGKVQRLITGGTGLIFKGSGFYITDYKDKNKDSGDKKTASSADKDNGSKKSGSGSEKSDKKTKKNTSSKSDK